MLIPSAIIKLSWNLSKKGDAKVQGGVAGTCFSLTSGETLTATHVVNDDIFRAAHGCSLTKTLILHPDGSYFELNPQSVSHVPGTDVSVLSIPPSSQKFDVAESGYESLSEGEALGYEANTAPFEIKQVGIDLSIEDVRLQGAIQGTGSHHVRRKTCKLSKNDVTIDDKRMYLIRASGTVGMSGGPFIDPKSGAVFGVNSIGFPIDSHKKDEIGSVYIGEALGLPEKNESIKGDLND